MKFFQQLTKHSHLIIKMPKPYHDNFNKPSNLFNIDNGFNKKIRSLKKYCPSAYKYMIFELNEAIIRRRNTGVMESVVLGINDTLASILNIKNVDYSKEHIKEEIADVMVMLKQFQLYYDISTDDIKKIMKEKVDRQLERIAKEDKSND